MKRSKEFVTSARNVFVTGVWVLMACLLLNTVPAISAEGAWQVILEPAISHQAIVAGFLNETFGITAGEYGNVYYTTDGGKTWLRGKMSSEMCGGLDIVNESIAWAAEWARVHVSTDGGQTWRGVRHAHTYHLIRFLDETTGWIANISSVWATTDGGHTWQERTLPEDIAYLVAIDLRSPTDGYLVDEKGILYTTQDGGQTWSAESLDVQKTIIKGNNFAMGAIRFIDQDHGLIILALEGGEVIAMRTADGGHTWQSEPVPSTPGVMFLTHDGTTLTVYLPPGQITVLRYQTP